MVHNDGTRIFRCCCVACVCFVCAAIALLLLPLPLFLLCLCCPVYAAGNSGGTYETEYISSVPNQDIFVKRNT